MRSIALRLIALATTTWLLSCGTSSSEGTSLVGDTAPSADTAALTDAAISEEDVATDEDATITSDASEFPDASDGGLDTSSPADTTSEADVAVDTDAAVEPDTAVPEAKYVAITAATLHTWLESKDFLLINVHIPYAGDIPSTDANIAYTNLVGLVSALDHDLGKKAVLYCLTGPMSTKAVNDLVALGYYNVTDLTGGMNAWKAAGFTLEQNPQN